MTERRQSAEGSFTPSGAFGIVTSAIVAREPSDGRQGGSTVWGETEKMFWVNLVSLDLRSAKLPKTPAAQNNDRQM